MSNYDLPSVKNLKSYSESRKEYWAKTNVPARLVEGYETVRGILEGVYWNNTDPFEDFGIYSALSELGYSESEIEKIESDYYKYL